MQPQMDNSAGSLDPQSVNMAKAIRQVESGGDFGATGKSGEYGAYQFTQPTWSKYSQEYGINVPLTQATKEQQNEVAYRKIKDWKDQGYNVGQVASMWNSGKPDAYLDDTYKGVNKSGAKYDVPAYARSVAQAYQTIKSGGQVSEDPNNPSAVMPTDNGSGYQPPAPPSADVAKSQPPSSDQMPESIGGKAWDVAKGVGNFLFPIAGDIKHDIEQGSVNGNGKTLLQQGGDLALSALPFIPGLGEAGEGARTVEGAGALSKILGSTITKGAGIGYGAGMASNLSQGKGVGESLTPGVNNVGGALLGGSAPLVLKGASSLIKNISDVSPQIENALKTGGISVEDYNKYIQAAKSHATDIRSTTPLTMAADKLDEASKMIQDNTNEAGKAVGAAKTLASNVPVKRQGIIDTATNFANQVQEKYGLNLSSNADGKVTAIPTEGSMRQVSPSDTARIENVANQLNKLFSSGEGASVKQTSEIISNLNELVDHTKSDLYGHTNDPLEALLKSTAGDLNKAVRDGSPELAVANDRYSSLKNLQDEIGTMAGKNLNRGELLMKRVFSGDKSGDVQDFFNKIKGETGIDLTNHAVLAKHAIESAGDSTQKTLLDQMLQEGNKGNGLWSSIVNLAKNQAKKAVANPETIGRNAIRGKTGLLQRTLSNPKGIFTKGAIEAGSRAGNLTGL